MTNWRSSDTKYKQGVLARQVVRNVKGDLNRLNQSQRDMLAALAVRDQGMTPSQACIAFNTANSSLGFARTILRFMHPTVASAVLEGLLSVHKADAMRREYGADRASGMILSLSEEAIRGLQNRIGTRRSASYRKGWSKNTDIVTVAKETPEVPKAVRDDFVAADKAIATASVNVSDTSPTFNMYKVQKALAYLDAAKSLANVGEADRARDMVSHAGGVISSM